jgi:hypothetical protein
VQNYEHSGRERRINQLESVVVIWNYYPTATSAASGTVPVLDNEHTRFNDDGTIGFARPTWKRQDGIHNLP